MFLRISVLMLGALVLTVSVSAQMTTIASARNQAAGSSVTVRGIVTTGAEMGKTRYLQDGTAGLAIYPGQGSAAGFEKIVKAGDSIEISGKLTVYNNLLEISPITAYRAILTGQPLPKPKTIRLGEVGPAYESQLVHLEQIRFADRRDTFSGNISLAITDSMGYKNKVYIPKDSPLAGAPVPSQSIPLIAIVSRFRDFQLLPLNLEQLVAKVPEKEVELETNNVQDVLRIMNCPSGKITVNDATGKEQLFAIAHSSGTTQLDVSVLPPGPYTALVKTQGSIYKLPFQKH